MWKSIKNRLAILKSRPDTEHEQIYVRISIVSCMLVYVLVLLPSSEVLQNNINNILIIYFSAVGISIALFIHLLFFPQISKIRRIIGAATDAIGVNAVIFYSGEPGMLFYPFLLWLVIGHGFRFGQFYLLFAALLSVTLFATVTQYSEPWRQVPVLDVGLIIGLVILPLYFAILLNKLQSAVDSAVEANTAKSKFLANMSHELRTPLNAVIGSSELLSTTKIDANQKEMVNTIRTAAHSLLALVNDVLDLARIESKQMRFERTSFDLIGELKAVQRMLLPQARDKSIYLRLRLDPSLPFDFTGYAGPLRQTLVNLVANAIKFTSRGGVLFETRFVDMGDGQRGLRFEVHDTGKGIRIEEQVKIFDRFSQAEADGEDRPPGSGLGLSIARELVETMNGQIGVISAPGVGSTFWFEIPFTDEPHPLTKVPAFPPGSILLMFGKSTETKVLHQIEVVRKRFEADQADIIDVQNLNHLKRIRDELDGHFTLLLIGDTEPAGFDQLMRIIEDQHGSEQNNLITLANERHRHIRESFCDLSGLDSPELVLNALFLSFTGRFDDGANDGAEIHGIARRAKNQGRILLAEDNKVNRQVISRMLSHAGHMVDEADNGQAVLDMSMDQRFDVIILDINMPVMDGWDTFRLLRFGPEHAAEVPIIALTADATNDTRQRAADLGFCDFLTKPVDYELLIVAIDRLIEDRRNLMFTLPETNERLSQADQPGTEQVTDLPLRQNEEPEDNRQILDQRKIHNLIQLDDGDGFFASIVEEYIDDMNDLISELETAVQSNKVRKIRDTAHALKSSSAHMGAKLVFERCMRWREYADETLMKNGLNEIQGLKDDFARVAKALKAKKGEVNS